MLSFQQFSQVVVPPVNGPPVASVGVGGPPFVPHECNRSGGGTYYTTCCLCRRSFVGIDVAFYLPLTLMEGNFLRTAARTRRFSVGVPFWATRASALRAWDASGMGYLRSSGMANVEFFIRLRLLILLMVSPFR